MCIVHMNIKSRVSVICCMQFAIIIIFIRFRNHMIKAIIHTIITMGPINIIIVSISTLYLSLMLCSVAFCDGMHKLATVICLLWMLTICSSVLCVTVHVHLFGEYYVEVLLLVFVGDDVDLWYAYVFIIFYIVCCCVLMLM